jgi:hypothetical protein
VAGGLLGVLRAVVQAAVLPLCHAGQALALRRSIARQCVGDDHLGQIPLVVHAPRALLYPTPDEAKAGADTLSAALSRRWPAAAPLTVERTASSPRELAFDVERGTEGGLLVTARWARSWRVQGHGIAHPLDVGNVLFRAVLLSAGQSRVRFTYHPVAFPWLVVLSGGGLAIIGMWAAGAAFHYRTPGEEQRASSRPKKRRSDQGT